MPNLNVSAHLLLVNPSVDSRHYTMLPRGQLHVLDRPASVNKVKTRSRSRNNNHRKVSTHNPTPRCTILCQLLHHLLLLDENEPPLLPIICGPRGSSSLENLQLHLCRNFLRIELANMQLGQNRLVPFHVLPSLLCMLESVPILKNSLDSNEFAIRGT